MFKRVKNLFERLWPPKKRSADLVETELLATRIGLGLIACQLVERGLHRVMSSWGERWDDLPHRPTLGQMVARLRRTRPALEEATDVLDEFTKKRNAFVHNLLDADGAGLNDIEGRAVCYALACEIHTMSRPIMHEFGEISRIQLDAYLKGQKTLAADPVRELPQTPSSQ